MSGVVVPDGWEEVNISDIADVVGGGTPDRSNIDFWENGTVFWATPTDITAIHNSNYIKDTKEKITEKGLSGSSAKLLPIGSILLTSRATIGERKIARIQVCTNQGFTSLVPKDSNGVFIYYLLDKYTKYMYSRAYGTTFPEISRTEVKNIKVVLPKEKKEQEKIAKILSTLDKNIENTNKIIEKEKNIKKALMQELLTNGIDKNNKIRSPKTHTYKQSKLGLIPEEWEVKKIENIADIFGGGTPDRSNNDFWENGTIFWATPTDITAIYNSNYIEDTKEKISEKGLSGSSAKLLPIGSILLTSRATIGERKISKIPICTNQGFTSLVPKGDNGIFIYYLLDKYIAYMYSRAYGTTFPEISRTQVKNMPIALPKDENEQKQITKILTTQDKKIQTEERNIAKLKELKKGLMSDLLSGKVRVKV